jgi:hypothetical protein
MQPAEEFCVACHNRREIVISSITATFSYTFHKICCYFSGFLLILAHLIQPGRGIRPAGLWQIAQVAHSMKNVGQHFV